MTSVWLALLMVIAGWMTRDSNSGQRIRVAAFWMSILGSSILWLTLMALQRRHSERRAGRLIFRLQYASLILPRLSRVALDAIPLAFVAGMSWALLRSTLRLSVNPPSDPVYGSVLAGALAGLLVAAVGRLLWSRVVWVAELGLIHQDAFIPWQRISEFRSNKHDADVVVLTGPVIPIAMRIPSTEREAVEAVLKEKLGAER